MTHHVTEKKQENHEGFRRWDTWHAGRASPVIPPEATYRYQPWRMAFAYTHLETLPALNWAEDVLSSLPLPSCLEKLIVTNFP